MDGEERRTLFEEFGVPTAILIRVDVVLRLFGVHGMPTFGPFIHGRNGSALGMTGCAPGVPGQAVGFSR